MEDKYRDSLGENDYLGLPPRESGAWDRASRFREGIRDAVDLAKLTRLQGDPTRYELIAEHGERRILIAYSVMKTRAVLVSFTLQYGPELIALTGMGEDDEVNFGSRSAKRVTIGEWTIRFSGRTQREAVSSELPWIGAKAVQA